MDPDAHSESEKTRFNKGCAGIVIKKQKEVRVPRSQAEGESARTQTRVSTGNSEIHTTDNKLGLEHMTTKHYRGGGLNDNR